MKTVFRGVAGFESLSPYVTSVIGRFADNGV